MKPIVGVLMVALGVLVDGRGSAGQLPPATLNGWNQYVSAVEARRRTEVGHAERFLVMDHLSSPGMDRRQLVSGELVVRRVDAAAPGSHGPMVEDAMVHHWQGAVLLRGADLDAVMTHLQTEAPPTSAEVRQASVLARGPSFIKVFLRLQRTKLVTAVYNTEHDVTFVKHGPTRAESRSVATHIAEVANAGTPQERELAPGDDRGFLWRLNAYWRYQRVPEGVIAECESISLSRDVPFGLGAVVGPVIRSTARESMERTLTSLRTMTEGPGAAGPERPERPASPSGPVGPASPSGAS